LLLYWHHYQHDTHRRYDTWDAGTDCLGVVYFCLFTSQEEILDPAITDYLDHVEAFNSWIFVHIIHKKNWNWWTLFVPICLIFWLRLGLCFSLCFYEPSGVRQTLISSGMWNGHALGSNIVNLTVLSEVYGDKCEWVDFRNSSTRYLQCQRAIDCAGKTTPRTPYSLEIWFHQCHGMIFYGMVMSTVVCSLVAMIIDASGVMLDMERFQQNSSTYDNQVAEENPPGARDLSPARGNVPRRFVDKHDADLQQKRACFLTAMGGRIRHHHFFAWWFELDLKYTTCDRSRFRLFLALAAMTIILSGILHTKLGGDTTPIQFVDVRETRSAMRVQSEALEHNDFAHFYFVMFKIWVLWRIISYHFEKVKYMDPHFYKSGRPFYNASKREYDFEPAWYGRGPLYLLPARASGVPHITNVVSLMVALSGLSGSFITGNLQNFQSIAFDPLAQFFVEVSRLWHFMRNFASIPGHNTTWKQYNQWTTQLRNMQCYAYNDLFMENGNIFTDTDSAWIYKLWIGFWDLGVFLPI